jgi:hypothetical protein
MDVGGAWRGGGYQEGHNGVSLSGDISSSVDIEGDNDSYCNRDRTGTMLDVI